MIIVYYNMYVLIFCDSTHKCYVILTYRQVWNYERNQYKHMGLHRITLVFVAYFGIAARKADALQVWNSSEFYQTHCDQN